MPDAPDMITPEYRRSADPRAYYAPLREKGPIDTTEGLAGRVQVLGHEEADRVLHDYTTFSSAAAGHLPGRPRLIPIQLDPPEHAHYRRLLDPVFTRRNIAHKEHEIAALSNELIDRFYARGECDFSEEFSQVLPSAIFLKIFGLPFEELDFFLDLKNRMLRPLPGLTLEEQAPVRQQAGVDARELFERVIEERRADPQDDLITRLITAEVDGQRLSQEDLLSICQLMLLAGLDTVSISLQCMLHHLATHPEDRRFLVADLDSRVEGAVEELLRWESPITGVSRRATCDFELAGQAFPSGTDLQVMLGAVNTDPATHPGFDAVDLGRTDNRHVAFGGGVHRCLGSHLARLELRTALREWHRRIPEYELAPGTEIVWNGAALRGIDHLPLVWQPS